MSSLLSIPALLVFPLLMAFAASSDLLTMRISNKLVFALVLGFVALALFVGLPLEVVGMHFACAGIVLVAGFAFFAFGWIGGGDAKLAAATHHSMRGRGFDGVVPIRLIASSYQGSPAPDRRSRAPAR